MSIHRQKADEAFLIGHRGQYTPVGAYVFDSRVVADHASSHRMRLSRLHWLTMSP